ncbi:protein FAM83H-like [Dunckerocampus dactyliophorus]|uniref:protein FAM83H-like n=1 Tax=Dunckerocampus dactyliophorus TaxID=161453 RepID=UPI0024061C6C|nr:protein FAM83H-like [Dunckerocampus dactyliophorus]
MARRSQCSSAGDNPRHPNYLPPHYREEYRLAIDALVEEDLEGYYEFLQRADVVDFLSSPEIQYIQSSVHVPQQSNYQEQTFIETGGESSSDTYWPIHSDLDAPGLDLGWPQLHLFGGPTEVTTLVNPPEPDMPSIKEQARRLIKNAQQVIAIVMDMFTDVDVFADILNAAMRNVAVYILLDEQNAHHFMNMVSNCRVNLQSIQLLRVRTVSGITYHCRSGKSFKGQMMDRFLLTDCRAVLSGNYSFMWSFEKLHRCMAHLFLGQLVSTFDEEFRILFAQSQPLLPDVPVPMEDVGLLQRRPYPSKRTSLTYREPRKLLPMDIGTHAEDWTKTSYDEQIETDWRMLPNRTLHGPVDVYSRFPAQQSGMEPHFNQGHSKFPMMESPVLKRHSYVEGAHGRYNYPFLAQPTTEFEARGRLFHRGQPPNVGPGPEVDYSGPEKFWSQQYHSADQYSEPGLPQEMEPFDNFDPVLNYLSSTRNVDFEQVSEKLQPPADLPLSSSQHQRLKYSASPTPPNTVDDKQFFQEPNTDRKDPMVKRGLRNWRINSYLSAFDNPDEGLPVIPPQAPDPFEDPSNPVQQTQPVIELSIPKIPNVREFKIPALPRASQLPSYAKAFTLDLEQAKKLPEESVKSEETVSTETKTTPTPSESSSTTEGDKPEEAEQREPNTAVRKEESFRRKYNAAIPRSSRLRSSLIFSSLEQHTAGQQDEEGDKNETEQAKLPFVSQALGQRRSGARESYGWSRYLKSATFDSAVPEASKQEGSNKPDDKDSSNEDSKSSTEHLEVQEPLKLPNIEQGKLSPSMSRLMPSESDMAKTDHPPKTLVTNPLSVDMSDPDKRLMFFKELAAKRKAAMAAEAEKSTQKVHMKTPTDPNVTVKKEGTLSNDGMTGDTSAQKPEALISLSSDVATKDLSKTKSTEPPFDGSDEINEHEGQVSNVSVIPHSAMSELPRVSNNSNEVEMRNSQTAASLSVSAETEGLQCDSEDPELQKSALSECSSGLQAIVTQEKHANLPSLELSTDASVSPVLESTSNESTLAAPSLGDSSSSASSRLNSNIQTRESSQLENTVTSPSPSLESSIVTQSDAKIPNSEHSLSISGLQTTSSPHDSNINSAPSILSLTCDKIGTEKPVSVSPQRSSQSTEETSQKSSTSVRKRESQSAQDQIDSISQSQTLLSASVDDTVQEHSDVSHKNYASDSEPNPSSLQHIPKTNTDKSSSLSHYPLTQKASALENVSGQNPVTEESWVSSIDVPSPIKDIKGDILTHSLSSTSHEPSILTLTLADPFIEPLRQANSLCEPNPTESRTSAETDSCLSLSESVTAPSQTEGLMPTLHGSSNVTLLTNGTLAHVKAPMQSTSVVTSVTTEPGLASKKPDADNSEVCQPYLAAPLADINMCSQIDVSQESKLSVPCENKTEDSDATNTVKKSTALESGCSERINEQTGQTKCPEVTVDEGVLSSQQQSKLPKSSQSRYHSSTANVLSSSNLRDDTKLLLEQISANSQSRNESTKELPVTDDEKEDEADKNAKRDKEREIGSLSSSQATQDRDKLLQKLQSMRKERKVYSRFEMAP